MEQVNAPPSFNTAPATGLRRTSRCCVVTAISRRDDPIPAFHLRTIEFGRHHIESAAFARAQAFDHAMVRMQPAHADRLARRHQGKAIADSEHAAAVGQDSVQLARSHAGRRHRARPVRAVGQHSRWRRKRKSKEFVDAAKSASPPFKMGGTGSKREDQVLTVFMEKKTGAKFLTGPYKSGGEAATELVGNHTLGQRQQSVGEPRGPARRPGARALRVRQGAHRLQDQGHGDAILERHPDLQGGRAPTRST